MFPFTKETRRLPVKYMIGEFFGLLGMGGVLGGIVTLIGRLAIDFNNTPKELSAMVLTGYVLLGIGIVSLIVAWFYHVSSNRWLEANP